VVGTDPQPIEIVGVVGHVKQWGLDGDATAPVHNEMYFTYMQFGGPLLAISVGDTSVIVRSSVSPGGSCRRSAGRSGRSTATPWSTTCGR
jgi:hypothetical protein